MPHVLTRTAYNFDELSDAAKRAALDKFYHTNVQDNWWDSTYEDLREILKRFGFSSLDISFSGFWSQGDSASFTGTWRPEDVNLNGFKDEFQDSKPTLFELHDEIAALMVARRFQDAPLPTIRLDNRHRGAHEHWVEFEFEWPDHPTDPSTDDQTTLKEWCRNLMRYCYRRLEDEYDHLTSEEAIKETIEANDYSFDEDGSLV